MGTTIYIVGQYPEDGTTWMAVGVYDDEAKAVAACKDWTYFVGPMILNETTPEAPMIWPGCYYPKGIKATA